MTSPKSLKLRLQDEESTTNIGRRLSPLLDAGDVVLLSGQIGAGKTHLARAIIQARLLAGGLYEEVPSPTFTLVQTYFDGRTEIWHADLYRLTDPVELVELGLEDAYENAITLIEWPDRLGKDVPQEAISIHLALDGDGRTLTARAPQDVLDRLSSALEGAE